MSKKVKKVKPAGLFHINVPIGSLPPHRAREYMKTMSDGFKKAFKKHGKTVVTGYHGDGRVEIIRVI